MALAPDDVLLLQRADGARAHFKLTLSDLGSYIDAQDIVRFRGTRDFTDDAEDPSSDGTGRVNGDMYINTGVGVLVANNWADMDGNVSTGDRAVWNAAATKWEVITSNSSTGGTITAVRGTLPIEVNSDNPTQPIVSIRTASRGSDPATNSGAVARLALDAEVAIGGTTGNTAVVTANQLRATNESIVARLPDGTAEGQYLRWSGTAWAGSDVIDGGEYAT